jgi:hypothetical protein
MNAGHILAKVRYARASTATPSGPTDWTITDVASAATHCRANDCAMGEACVQTTGVCTATGTGCTAACSATQACVMGSCQAIYGSNWIEDFPPGIGLFNSLRTDSMGAPQLVFYDRDRGNLMGARLSGSTWSTFIIDGENPDHSDISDRGAWSTLAVASDGTWHIAYVDGWTENVMYVSVPSGMTTGTPEVVDDGLGLGTTPFEDGDHVIGDSAEIDLDATGHPRLVYQDSTAGTLRYATRGTSGWTVAVQDMMNSTGYWSRTEHGQIAVFYRDLSHSMNVFGVRLFPAM